MSNYFQIEAVSNSLLNKVDVFEKYGISSEYWNDTTIPLEGDFIEIGTGVDELISEELLMENIIEEYDLSDFTPTERKIIIEGKEKPLLDCYLEHYNNKEVKEYHKGNTVGLINKVEDLFIRARGYYNFLEINEGKRIVSKEVYNTIMKCYSSITGNELYNEIFKEGYKQLEVYWSMEDIPCKAKIDLLHVIDGVVHIADIKTHSTDLNKSIKQRNYIRQLSWYSFAAAQYLEQQGIEWNEFKYYIIGVHTKHYSTKIVEISEYDITCGQYGGCLKPEIFTIDKNFYLKNDQVEFLKWSNIWSDINEKSTNGWLQLIKIYNDRFRVKQ